ncbi:MAG TPA: LysM domain-containing protein, partial [Chloroflexota bacterium]|nr:LysM domain-containing protein [Chloroflexota bacterium]
EYIAAPERRFPSPSAQRRSGEHWKARVGLGFVVILTLCSAAVMFRIAGLGVGSAASSLRGPGTTAPPRISAAATAPSGSGQQPGSQQAAAPAAPTAQQAVPAANQASAPAAANQAAAPAATAAAPTATTAPAVTPTTRPGQREHVVVAGDTLGAIATRYSTTVDAIVAANNLSGRSAILNIGQRLIIP